jgi:hypothetical protein
VDLIHMASQRFNEASRFQRTEAGNCESGWASRELTIGPT